MTLQPLTDADIARDLAALNAGLAEPWVLADGALCRHYTFADFNAAFGFMARVALLAERQDHHPDWRNCWNRVEVRLHTHDAGGITARDFRLAAAMEQVFRETM